MAADKNAPLCLQGALCEQFSTIGANGAVSQRSGLLLVTKSGVCAMTLADPIAGDPAVGGDDGKRLTILAATASAHTLSNAAGSGFNAGGSGTDVGTYGGAKGDNIQIVAYGGKWYVEGKVNVTLA